MMILTTILYSMVLKNYYYYFPGIFRDKFCDEVIKHGNFFRDEVAITGKQTPMVEKNKSLTKDEVKDLKKKRDSNIVWLNDLWIYKEIHPYIHEANSKADWNFQWDWSESCQFTKYQLNQFYGWHCDSWEVPYSDKKEKNFIGKIRKLSATITLSDPKDYKGGELEFDFRNFDPDKEPSTRICKEILPKGSMVVFPSFLWHRVKPVTEGTRYSLVMWNLGSPYK